MKYTLNQGIDKLFYIFFGGKVVDCCQSIQRARLLLEGYKYLQKN